MAPPGAKTVLLCCTVVLLRALSVTASAVVIRGVEDAVRSDDHYIAAAAEHTCVEGDNPADTLQQNLNGYETTLEKAKENGVQIVVFPEFGLGGNFQTYEGMTEYCEPVPEVPSSNQDVIPCNEGNHTAVFQRGSCLAQKYNMTVVLSMCDLDVKNKKQYTADVVYDENGRYVTKYWKTHPFFTNLFDTPHAQYITFDTSFGVTFGVFICFDIYFRDPPQHLVDMGIRHFVHSQDLANILGPEVERGWTLVHGSTMIGSNLGDNYSGLFRKGRRLDTMIIESRDVMLDRLRVGAIPKKDGHPKLRYELEPSSLRRTKAHGVPTLI